MTKADLLKIDGIKDKKATKIYTNIQEALENTTLPELMQATNIFGRGLGIKKFTTVLNAYPDILTSSLSNEEKKTNLLALPGIAERTADQFIDKYKMFVEWTINAKLETKLNYTSKTENNMTENNMTENMILSNKKYVITGFRDNNLIQKLNSLGAKEMSSVSKSTDFVIVKNEDESTQKAELGRKLGILKTLDDIENMYNL